MLRKLNLFLFQLFLSLEPFIKNNPTEIRWNVNPYVNQNKLDSQKDKYHVFSLICRTCADVDVFGYVNVCLSVSVGDEVRKGTMGEKEGYLKGCRGREVTRTLGMKAHNDGVWKKKGDQKEHWGWEGLGARR